MSRQSAARAWIDENLDKIPLLTFKKIFSLAYLFANPFQHLILVLSMMSLLIWAERRACILILAVLVCLFTTTALSWVVMHGRFLLPLHPILLIGATAWLRRLELSPTGPDQCGYFRKPDVWKDSNSYVPLHPLRCVASQELPA